MYKRGLERTKTSRKAIIILYNLSNFGRKEKNPGAVAKDSFN